MTTWAGLRDTCVRIFMKDPQAKTWSDDELKVFCNLGLDNLSSYFPQQKSSTITPVADTYSYALPSDFRFLDAIAWPSGTISNAMEYLPQYVTKDYSWPVFGTSGLTGVNPAYLLGYPSEGYISFTRVPSTGVTLYYRGWRAHVVSDSDTLPFNAAWWMNEALSHYICYQAFLQLAGPRAQLTQWSEKPENVVGNPLAEQAVFWHRQYMRLIQENLPHSYVRFTEGFKSR